MRTLGIRVSGKELNLCIADSETKELMVDRIILPPLFEFPKKLKFLRFNLIDVLSEYNISTVSIKTIEYNSQNIDIERCFIEGVVQESLASSNVDNFYIETIQGLSKKLKINLNHCKLLIEKKNLLDNFLIDNGFNIVDTNKLKREAVLLAISILN